MKIAIIGNAGSGKSNFALQLHKKLGLPLYHLDQYFWKPGWVEPERAEFHVIHNQLCDKESWIIEGIATGCFEYRAQKADILIFIDMPTWLCFYRIFKRLITNFGKEYFSSAKGCPERGPSWKFLKFVWNFNKDRKPTILSILDQYRFKKPLYIIKNQKELESCFKQL